MATSFKNFLNNDVTSTRTLLHEAIPVTGSIVSGTYNDPAIVYSGSLADNNVKNYSHGMFQSVYDYPYLSSSANHIFDITVGYSNDSGLSSSANVQNSDKINIYSQMAQMLVGHDSDGNVRNFDQDGDLTGGVKLTACYFLNFARLLQKDEIKKGSFSLVLGSSSSFMLSASADAGHNGSAPFYPHSNSQPNSTSAGIVITDSNAQNSYKINSPAGEYAILYASGSKTTPTTKAGLLYYQAGVAVLTASVFQATDTQSGNDAGGQALALVDSAPIEMTLNPDTLHPGSAYKQNVNQMLKNVSISGSADAFRHRLFDLDFNNTTELNSTIYFCRAGHNEFNYSSNPSYIDSASKIRVKNSSLDQPVSYITTVGLYSADNELLAVAKVSEPLKKTPDTELTLRVRLDY
tara:strand:- start:118 stop:1335 length:1218 start_codon:yes stop_codon:yes gene_type:complete